MLHDIMTEYQMEDYLLASDYDVVDKEQCIDSTKVIEEAQGLGFDSYMLEGMGELNQTLIFIKMEA